jgi:hypothetical protein
MKNNFKKIKKNYFNIFLNKILLKNNYCDTFNDLIILIMHARTCVLSKREKARARNKGSPLTKRGRFLSVLLLKWISSSSGTACGVQDNGLGPVLF